MAHKLVVLEPRGLQTPRERTWAAACKLRSFTLLELQDATRPLVHFPTLETYAHLLRKAGHIEVIQPSQLRGALGPTSARYRLVTEGIDTPKLTAQGTPSTRGLVQLAMWRAMRVLREFDYRDVQRAASLDDFKLPVESARIYIKLLFRAGYLRAVCAAAGLKCTARYRLIKDTGPHAPVIVRHKRVLDRNTGSFVDIQSAQEVCDGSE